MVTSVTIARQLGEIMAKRKDVFAAADALWMKGVRPSVRKVTQCVRGSARDITPLVRAWWIERSTERRAVAGEEVKQLEERMDEQRRYYMAQIDSARQEAKKASEMLTAAQRTLDRYRKLIKDTTPLTSAIG